MKGLQQIITHLNSLMNTECTISCADVTPLVNENAGLLHFNITYKNDNFAQCTIKIIPDKNARPKLLFDPARIRATEKTMPDKKMRKQFEKACVEISKCMNSQPIHIEYTDMLTAAAGRCALQMFDLRETFTYPCSSLDDMKQTIRRLACIADIHTALEIEKKYTY